MRAAVLLLCTVALLAANVLAKPQGRGCIYVEGHCQEECPVGTHAYANGCSEIESERTCKQPLSRKLPGVICDYTRCECDEPNVLDEASGKCVPLDQCPKAETTKSS